MKRGAASFALRAPEISTPSPATSPAHWPSWALGSAGLVALATLLRLPFLGAPLTADEGGYAEIARLWAGGQSLYHKLWVDRPQGLILLFRAVRGAGLTSPGELRIAAIIAGALLVVVALSLGAALGGRSHSLTAGLLAATAGASPFIEGFTLSGELLAAILSGASIFLLVMYLRRTQPAALIAAGLLGGSAVMVKQSAFDAVLATTAYLALRRDRRAGGVAGAYLLAAAAPVALAMFGSGDPGAWANAIVGYGAHASVESRSLLTRPGLFAASIPAAAKALAPAIVLAALGWRTSPTLVRLWIGAAAAGVCVGGSFHPHYYLELVLPLSVAGGYGLATLRRRQRATAILAGALTVVVAAPLWASSASAQAEAIWPGDTHLLTDSAVARYVSLHTSPSQQIYVMWAAADVYYLADRASAGRYLWLRNLQTITNAVPGVDHMLAQGRPGLVVEAQPPALADPTGRAATILSRDYRLVARIDGVRILRPRPNG